MCVYKAFTSLQKRAIKTLALALESMDPCLANKCITFLIGKQSRNNTISNMMVLISLGHDSTSRNVSHVLAGTVDNLCVQPRTHAIHYKHCSALLSSCEQRYS